MIKKKSLTLLSWVLITILIVAVLFIAVRFWMAYQPEGERLQGQIDAQQYSVSSKVAGRIDDVRVKKGQVVKAGELIFTLSTPELDARLVQAQAGAAAAAAQSAEADKGARTQQIAGAKDQWQKAKVNAELSDKTYQRILNLHRQGIVPLQNLDEAKASRDAARSSQGMAWQEYQLALEGTRDEVKLAAQENMRKAAGSVAEVEAYLADAQISSPHDGEINNILLRQGELAPQGFPVVTLLDMSDAWMQLAVREDLLNRFTLGTEFDARIPALGNKTFRFKVTYVAVMGDFATWRATDTRQGFDMRTYEIEARPVAPIADLRVGMSVQVDL